MRSIILVLFTIVASVSGQVPLDIIQQKVVGAGGIIVGTTSLNEARQGFRGSDKTIQNFTYDQSMEDGTKIYTAAQSFDGMMIYWTVGVKSGLVKMIIIKTIISDVAVLNAVFNATVKTRTTRLGYPHTESRGMYGWGYTDTLYTLALISNNSGIMQMTEMISIKG